MSVHKSLMNHFKWFVYSCTSWHYDTVWCIYVLMLDCALHLYRSRLHVLHRGSRRQWRLTWCWQISECVALILRHHWVTYSTKIVGQKTSLKQRNFLPRYWAGLFI